MKIIIEDYFENHQIETLNIPIKIIIEDSFESHQIEISIWIKYKSPGGTIEEDQKTSDDLDRILEELRAENEVLWAKAAKWEIFLPVCIYVCF